MILILLSLHYYFYFIIQNFDCLIFHMLLYSIFVLFIIIFRVKFLWAEIVV